MRSFVALWVLILSGVFMAHTAAAAVAPYDACCFEDCSSVMGLCAVHCAACTAPATLTQALRPPTALQMHNAQGHNAVALPFPYYSLWTPPG
ncbi:MAG: hypothetical protein K2Q97_00210 [Burkholderiaceae bacterium]|nr:hypothetical protein [Burkholderiaceae bacterium]